MRIGNWKRLTALLVVCALVSAMLSGCRQWNQDDQIFLYEDDEEGGQDVTLRVFGYKADALNLLAIEDALHGYMEQTSGINITYEGLKGTTYWDALAKRASTGTLDDIIMVDHDRAVEFSSQGLLADLSGIPGLENYAELASSQFMGKDGTVWFLPACISAYGLYVNCDLLKSDGQTVPNNWEEFADVCDYYVNKGCAPIVMNNYSSLRSLIVAKGMYDVYQSENPGAEIDALNAGEKDLAELLVPGIEMAYEMIGRGWIDCTETLETTQTNGDLALFAEGERPFMVTGAWASPRVKDMDPGFEYGVYPYPILEDGGVLVVDASTCVAVNAGGGHLEEAMDFLGYLTEPDVMWNYCDSQSSYTPLKDDRTPTDQAIEPSAECLDSGRIVIGSDYRLTLPLDTALYECSVALLNGADKGEAKALLEKQLGQNE